MMTDGLSDSVKLVVTVRVQPEGDMSGEQAAEHAVKVVESALKYALPRPRFKPPFTQVSVDIEGVSRQGG